MLIQVLGANDKPLFGAIVELLGWGIRKATNVQGQVEFEVVLGEYLIMVDAYDDFLAVVRRVSYRGPETFELKVDALYCPVCSGEMKEEEAHGKGICSTSPR